ncbi:MAG: N-6 DNA methylase [Peptoniphilaceae bacterium]|nr:N-6 DNA methylase [Peptoniphilaceae bacterium]MDY6085329.1 N-6 DNA methylase [Peptoniphilaceae bacterium]
MDDPYAKIEGLEDTDARGDVYEYLLSKLSNSGVNGQFRTPRHIIKMMVNLVEPIPEDVICDPACGEGVIIMIEANNYVNIRSSRLLPRFKTQKINSWCAA